MSAKRLRLARTTLPLSAPATRHNGWQHISRPLARLLCHLQPRHSPLPPLPVCCPHGFADWDRCPDCCH